MPQKARRTLTQGAYENKHVKRIVVALADIHGHLEGIAEACEKYKANVLVIAGDIQPASVLYHHSRALCAEWFQKSFFPLIRSMKNEVVIIPGNHDLWLHDILAETFMSFKQSMRYYDFPSNLHILFDKEETVCGLKFYGTPWVPWINGSWAYESLEEGLREKFKPIPENLDILVTHSPPRIDDCAIDISLDNEIKWRRHYGSVALYEQIVAKKPSVVFCGHIHSGDHSACKLSDDKETLLYNCSRVNERYQVAYGATVLEISKRGIKEISCGTK